MSCNNGHGWRITKLSYMQEVGLGDKTSKQVKNKSCSEFNSTCIYVAGA